MLLPFLPTTTITFPVRIGAIPQGNVIFISDSPGNLPPGLALPPISSPTVAMRANPSDPYSKILVVAGSSPDQLVAAAQAVALHSNLLAGAQVTIDNLRLPDKQQPDGAPRWARSDQNIGAVGSSPRVNVLNALPVPLAAT